MIHLKNLNHYSICPGNLIHILILDFKILAFLKKEIIPTALTALWVQPGCAHMHTKQTHTHSQALLILHLL